MANERIIIKLPHNGKEVNFDSLSFATRAYLAQYGATQSVQDAKAGVAKDMRETLVNGKPKFSDAEIAKELISVQDEKWESIVNGTVGSRVGGPRLFGIDRIMRDVAEDLIRAEAANKKITLPKGENYLALREAYIKRNDAKVRAEAQRRMDVNSKIPQDTGLEALLKAS